MRFRERSIRNRHELDRRLISQWGGWPQTKATALAMTRPPQHIHDVKQRSKFRLRDALHTLCRAQRSI
jgi:hypothetical protein